MRKKKDYFKTNQCKKQNKVLRNKFKSKKYLLEKVWWKAKGLFNKVEQVKKVTNFFYQHFKWLKDSKWKDEISFENNVYLFSILQYFPKDRFELLKT